MVLGKYKIPTLNDVLTKIENPLFVNIELNMREIGHGDVYVNKNMKFLIKTFYNMLLNCENYNKKKENDKK